MAGTDVHRRFDASSLVGQRIVGLARVFFEHAGVLERDDGALEVVLENAVWVLDSDSDGERLRVREGAWVDPFEPPLSDENRAYVEEHGMWRRIDCSREQPYARMVGATIVEIRSLLGTSGQIAGLRLSTRDTHLWFVVEADECHVYWAHPMGFIEAPG